MTEVVKWVGAPTGVAMQALAGWVAGWMAAVTAVREKVTWGAAAALEAHLLAAQAGRRAAAALATPVAAGIARAPRAAAPTEVAQAAKLATTAPA